MKTTWLRIICIAGLLFHPLLALSGQDDELEQLQTKLGNEWVLLKNDRRHNIKTYTKQEDGKRFRSFKAEAVLDGKIEDYVRVLLDFDNYKRWSWNVIESRLLRRVSDTQYFFYVTHDAPYGVPDRDVILQMTFEPQTANKPYFSIRTTAVPDMLPKQPPFVRMLAEDMTVRVTPQGSTKYLISVEGYVDPGGVMASWAINFVQRNGPYVTLLGVRRVTQLAEYAQATNPLPFPMKI